MTRIFHHGARGAFAAAVLLLAWPSAAPAASPCAGSVTYLAAQYEADGRTRAALDLVHAGLQDLPAGYSYGGSSANPWKAVANGADLAAALGAFFEGWCTAPPEIDGSSDNALDPILYFAWLYFRNSAGQDFVQGRDPADPAKPLTTGTAFLSKFNAEYRAYMDSPESAAVVAEWIADPRIEIEDYAKREAGDYASWNAFFTRNLVKGEDGGYPSRPVTMPERDYVIVAPTDCIMNPLVQVLNRDGTETRRYIENPLAMDTVLDVKSIPISLDRLLGGAPEALKEKFVGGSGLACVLMPNTYHHFHAPVDGTILHAEIVETGTPGTPGTFGYPDFPNWVPPSGDVGRPGTDFSQFQAFQRGVIVIEVKYANLPGREPAILTGYVASIPVGLDSVGSVVFAEEVKPGVAVKKGVTELGNFFYGGSLDILLFSKGMVSPAVQTRMGNQIAIIEVGTAPRSPWSLD
ncbi:MAG: phosphatidylserine decarboxylase [Rhodospirillaceae bacterium]|jgi:phosphatidylserine decarboxylase|nr:phosphatidylserine decarboxylase [Rhodospirillaceae bacterium]